MVSYVEKRTQFIKLGQFKNVATGVPQGSVLGPLFFLVYINDIGKLKLHGSPKLFADDTALFYNMVTSMQEMLQHMQEDLVVLSEYFRINKLAINADKTNYVIFISARSNHNLNAPLRINNKLTRARYVKYLCLYID
ncbi:hypothetical protein PR048_006037 [Dryococelus australis]|uniref:Reverse transcriptase domain-containing protein n=1 Tax=Dryococelus australis TaxID=614101 RepID=A0ABQ9IAX3_9NEOP|nr:hypothetical protein PR048_006037 [Dryococelus australis]